MKPIHRISVLICFFALSATSFATDDAAAYLRNDFSARSSAMGGASVAIANDARLIYNNPASLAGSPPDRILRQGDSSLGKTPKQSLNFINFNKLETIYYTLHYHKAFRKLHMDVGWRNAHVGGIIITDTSQSITIGGTDKQVGNQEFAPHRITGEQSWDASVYHLALATTLHPRLHIGGLVKYLHEDLVGYTGSGHGFDVGLLATVPQFDRYHIGLAIHDVTGTRIRWESGTVETIERRIRIGGAGYFLDHRLLLTTEAQHHHETTWAIGAELELNERVRLRAGNNKNNLSFGVGLDLRPILINFSYQHENFLYNNNIFKLDMALQWGAG